MNANHCRRRLGAPVALLVVLILSVCLAAAAVAGAQGKRCHPGSYSVDWAAISDGSGAAGEPSTDGVTVVWADDRHGNLDIYAYDIETDQETAVCVAGGNQTDPVLCDGEVYWIDRSTSVPSVWTARPGGAVKIADGPADHLAASDIYVVWTAQDGSDADIMGYAAGSHETFVVCDAPGYQVHPAASDDMIAWEDYRNGSEADVYAWYAGAGSNGARTCDPATVGGELPICEIRGNQVSPSVYGSVVLWADSRSADWDIYGADACALQGEWGCNWSGISAVSRTNSELNAEFVVCDDDGDQVQPVVSGPMAYWSEQCDGAAQADITGVDLTWGDPFVVCDADGPQTAPAAGDHGQYVAWLDGSGDKPVVAGGALKWADGDDGDEPGGCDEWTTDDVITVFLSALADLGVFDEVRFAVDDGEYGDWQPLDDTETVKIPSHDGAYTIHIQLANSEFDDGDAGSESNPLTIDVRTTLDTHGPVTQARGAVRVHKGGKAKLKFRVRDNLSPRANVQVLIRNRGGKVVRVVRLGERATGRNLSTMLTVRLPRGSYTYRVLARDLAGNSQRKAGVHKLIVK